MKRTFIYKDEKSDKFWAIEITGTSFTVNYGKTNTSGQTQTKEFADEVTCLKTAEKQIREKTKKGYVEVGDDGPAGKKEASQTSPEKETTSKPAEKSAKSISVEATPVSRPGKRTFIYQDCDTHKFWDIEPDGKKIIISYGKYGSKPRTDIKTYESEEKAKKELPKLVRKKITAGYMETTEGAEPLPDISHLLVKREFPFSTERMYVDGYEWDSLEKIRESLEDDVEWQLKCGVHKEPLEPALLDKMAEVIRQNFDDKHEIIRLANELAAKNLERTNPRPVKVKEPFVLPKNGKITKKLLKQMRDAIWEEDTDIVKAILEFGVTGNHAHNGNALFIDALAVGNPEIIRLMTPTLTDYMAGEEEYYRHHLWSFACEIFSCKKEVINAVLDAGYDLKKDPYVLEHIGKVKDLEVVARILQIIPLTSDSGQAMISAVNHGNIPLIDFLLERNACLDGMDYITGEFLMHIALLRFYQKNMDVIRRLLEKGADMHAVSKGYLDRHGNTEKRTGGGKTPMSAFTESVGRYGGLTPEIKKLFSEYEGEVNFTPEQAFKAAREAQPYILEHYLKNNDVNIRDENGATLLHHTLLQESNTDTEKMIRMLVEKGIDVNAKDKNGRNALFYMDIRTCYFGQLSVVEYLKQQGIDINCTDNNGMTPIMFHTIQRPEKYDGENNENSKKDSEYSGRASALKFLTRAGADLNRRFADGKTIFHYIPTLPTFFEDDEIVEEMMKKGGDPNLMDDHGKAPLHYCISEKYIVGMDDRIDVYVKKGKANVNAQDKEGNTPLHSLILNGESRSVKDLLRHGANPCIPNNEGKTAEDLMKEKGILDNYADLLAEFHAAPPETRNIEHIWQPVEIVGKDNNEPIKQMELYGSLVLKGRDTGDHIFTAGKNRMMCSDLHQRFTCINSLSGETIWEEKDYGGHSHAFYHPEDDLIYSGYDHRAVVATDPATGETVWKVHIAFSYDTFSSSFILYEDTLLLFHSKSSAYAINKTTKKIQWKVKFSGDLKRYKSVVWKNYYIIQLDKGDKAVFNLINITTGEVERTIEQEKGFKDRYGGGIVVENDLWYISDDGSMCCLDLESGKMKDMAFTTEYIHDSRKLFIHGFYYVNGKFYFRISLIHHDGSEDGFYECDKDMNIKKILPYTEMFEQSYVKGDTLYFISQHNHTVSALSLTEKTIREIELPRYSGLDIIESYPHVNNGTLFITQLGGNENDDKQILYAIR